MSGTASSVSRWKRLRHRLEWLLCAGFAAVVPRLPRLFCARLAEAVGWLAFHLDRRGREVARANLLCIFGDRHDAAERDAIAIRSYQSFARTMFDLFWAPALTAENWRDYLEIVGDPRAGAKPGQGMVMMCVHWGNFEWASLAIGFLGIPTSIVAESFKNSLLSGLFNGNREVSGHTIVPQENSMIRFLKLVKKGGATGMLVDLTLRPEQGAIPLEAFGRKLAATPMHAVLAERGGARLVPVHGEPLPDGRCRVTIDPPLELPAGATTAQIAQICWDHYEKQLRQRPELWMWAYKHWRYRPGGEDPALYPSYANVSSKFDKLLAGKPVSGKKRPSGAPRAMENGAAH